MSEPNLRQRVSEMFSASDNLSIELITAFTNHELRQVETIVQDEIISSFLGPTGGWLDSPKAVAAALTQAIRKRAEL